MRVFVAGVASVPLFLHGCGSDNREAGNDPGGPATFESVVAALGLTASYNPAESPKALSRDPNVSLIVSGAIGGLAEGRTYGNPSGSSDFITTLVMEVVVEDVLQGDMPANSQGSVYLEFDGTPSTNVAELEEALGQPRVLLYLWEQPPHGVYPGVKPTNDGAGLPSGQPLFRPVTPQGFYLEDPETGHVLQPQESLQFPNAVLEDLGPDAERFPPSEPFRGDVRRG